MACAARAAARNGALQLLSIRVQRFQAFAGAAKSMAITLAEPSFTWADNIRTIDLR